MQTLALIFLILYARSSFQRSLEFPCEKLHKICTLRNVSLASESDLDQVVFPNITDTLTFASGKIPHFTRKLMDKLSGVEDLTINQLEVETLYVKPEIVHLEAVGNQITNLLVDGDTSKDYKMLTLNLSNNNLKEVEVLTRFNNLHILTLDNNNIKSLSMDLFGNMKKLSEISLENNQIESLGTSKKLQLLKLRSLSLAGNKLVELDVTMWELPTLKLLDLSNNKIHFFYGSLDQFQALEDVRLSRNNWQCDFLKSIKNIEKLKLDADQPGRCEKEEYYDIQKICCAHNTSSLLEEDELFKDKWNELHNLQQSFQGFKNETKQSLQRIGELPEDRSLMERFAEIEQTQKKIQDRLNEQQESVAMQKVNELRSIIDDHKSTITNLETKQSDLESKLDGFVESLNNLRESLNEKFKKIDEISPNVHNLEQTKEQIKREQEDFFNKTTAELKKTVESQQFKYLLSSADLKNQIGKERSRVSEMKSQLSTHDKELDHVNQKLAVVMKMLDQLVGSEEN